LISDGLDSGQKNQYLVASPDQLNVMTPAFNINIEAQNLLRFHFEVLNPNLQYTAIKTHVLCL